MALVVARDGVFPPTSLKARDFVQVYCRTAKKRVDAQVERVGCFEHLVGSWIEVRFNEGGRRKSKIMSPESQNLFHRERTLPWDWKPYSHKEPLKSVVMLCLKENEENEKQVLILRRGKTAPNNPGAWSLPGGYTDLGESAVQTAVRELQEETGLVAHDAKELGKPYASPKDSTYGMAAVVCYCQNALDLGRSSDCPGGLPICKKLGYPENDAFEWVTIDQAFSAEFEQCSTANLALIAHVLSKNSGHVVDAEMC